MSLWSSTSPHSRDELRAVRLLYRCRRCEVVRQRWILVHRHWTRGFQAGARYIPGRLVSETDYAGTGERLYQQSLECPTCTRALYPEVVRGSYSERRTCDVRCTSAVGHDCECQCGGANHGADHAAI